jgi:hypothetical protein
MRRRPTRRQQQQAHPSRRSGDRDLGRDLGRDRNHSEKTNPPAFLKRARAYRDHRRDVANHYDAQHTMHAELLAQRRRSRRARGRHTAPSNSNSNSNSNNGISKRDSADDAVAFARAGLLDVVMHEVGHTLGMRHSFSASTHRSLNDMQDVALTRAHGLYASVMDYAAINPGNGTHLGEPFMSTIGPHDHLVIVRSYATFPHTMPAGLYTASGPGAAPHGAVDFADPAAVSTFALDQGLPSFCTDEDDATSAGQDPLCNYFDLAKQPLDFHERQLEQLAGLWAALGTVTAGKSVLVPGDDFAAVHAAVHHYIGIASSASEFAAKFIGGYTVWRGRVDAAKPVLPTVAASPAVQRRALGIITRVLTNSAGTVPPPAVLAQSVARKGTLGMNGPGGCHDAVRTERISTMLTLVSVPRMRRARDQAWADAQSPDADEILKVVTDTLCADFGTGSLSSGFDLDTIDAWFDVLASLIATPGVDAHFAGAARRIGRAKYLQYISEGTMRVNALPETTAGERRFADLLHLLAAKHAAVFGT